MCLSDPKRAEIRDTAQGATGGNPEPGGVRSLKHAGRWAPAK